MSFSGASPHVTIVGKYPPLQGGTASQILWLSYRLIQIGWRVTVVTTGSIGGLNVCSGFEEDDWSELFEHYPEVAAVQRIEIDEEGAEASSIPMTDGLPTRLSSAAVNAVRANDSSVIISAYLEPYGVAGYIVSQLTGRPHVLMHAGSDLGRLARMESRQTLYREVLQNADLVASTPAGAIQALAFGISHGSLIYKRPALEPSSLYLPVGPIDTIADVCSRREAMFRGGDTSDITPDTPVVAMYGKLGERKGLRTFVEAIDLLHQRNSPAVALLIVPGGSMGQKVVDLVRRRPSREKFVVLPFLPTWRLPSLLRSVSVVCALERGFTIGFHRSQIPREAAACGTRLVISNELARQQQVKGDITTSADVVVVGEGGDLLAPEVADGIEYLTQSGFKNEVDTQKVLTQFYQPSDKTALDWTRRLIDSYRHSKGDRSVTLKNFQQKLLSLYSDPGERQRWSASAVSEPGISLSEAEREALHLLAKNPELDRFASDILQKKWSFFERRFDRIFREYPDCRTAVYDRFVDVWRFPSVSLVSQIEMFADIVLEGARDAWPQGGPEFSDGVFEGAVRLCEATACVLLGNDWSRSTTDESSADALIGRELTNLNACIAVAGVARLLKVPSQVFDRSDPKPATVAIAVAPSTNTYEVQLLRVSQTIYRMLMHVQNRPMSVNDLIALTVPLSTDDFEDATPGSSARSERFVGALRKLIRRGVVEVVAHA